MPAAFSNIKLTGENAQPFPEDYMTSVYLMLKFVRDNLSQIQTKLEKINSTGMLFLVVKFAITKILDLLEQIKQTDWSKANEIEQFLATFYETAKEFGNTKEPMFQKVFLFFSVINKV